MHFVPTTPPDPLMLQLGWHHFQVLLVVILHVKVQQVLIIDLIRPHYWLICPPQEQLVTNKQY